VKKQVANVKPSNLPFMDLDPVDMGRVIAGEKDTCLKPPPGVRLEPVDLDLVIAGMKSGVIKSLRHLDKSEVIGILFSDGVWWSVSWVYLSVMGRE
jgi:hypothetical protein